MTDRVAPLARAAPFPLEDLMSILAPATSTALTDGNGDVAQDLLRLPAGHFRTALADPRGQWVRLGDQAENVVAS